MTENWIAVAACFTSGILSSMAAWAITYASTKQKIDHLERELKVYKSALASKDCYLTQEISKSNKQEKALADIQEILYGVPK